MRALVESVKGRKTRVSRHEIVNAKGMWLAPAANSACFNVFPGEARRKPLVHSCYHRWAWNGTLGKLHADLHAQVRSIHGKNEPLSAAILDR